jgi:hypothetical protein
VILATLGGRDQKDQSSKPAQETFKTLSWKNQTQNSWQRARKYEALNSKPSLKKTGGRDRTWQPDLYFKQVIPVGYMARLEYIYFNCSLKIPLPSWVAVAHICNPSYSGGRAQQNCCSKPLQTNSSQYPILKTVNTKKGWQSDSSGSKHKALSSNLSTTKRKNPLPKCRPNSIIILSSPFTNDCGSQNKVMKRVGWRQGSWQFTDKIWSSARLNFFLPVPKLLKISYDARTTVLHQFYDEQLPPYVAPLQNASYYQWQCSLTTVFPSWLS